MCEIMRSKVAQCNTGFYEYTDDKITQILSSRYVFQGVSQL